MMATCVHIACTSFISCQQTSGATGVRDMGKCKHCGKGVVFVPHDLLWVRANGHVADKVTCDRSPSNKHWVNR